MFDNHTSSILGSSDESEAHSAIAAYYSAALLGAHQNKREPADIIWGNLEIPPISSIPEQQEGWHLVNSSVPVDYSSLIGVRLQGICDDCNATIPIETSHTVLSCRSTAHFIDDTEVTCLLGLQFFGWLPSNRSYPFNGLARQVGADVTISSFIGSDQFFGIRPLGATDVSSMSYVVRGWYERD